MAHYWGSFADGFARGVRNGWDLGEKITSAWEKAKYARNQKETNEKYDNLEAQARADDAQINALNSGKTDAQAETSAAYGDYKPISEAGIREVAAINPDTGRWQATANNDSVAKQTADYRAEHTYVPFSNSENVKPESMRDAVAVFEKNGDYAPKKEAAVPRFTQMSLEDKLAQYRDERKQALSRLDRDYYAGDPEKSRALRKEAEEEDFNQRLLGVYRGALNGDIDALKTLADNAAAQGLIPEGTQVVPNRDGTFALVTEDGHIYEDETGSYGSVRLSREMIESAFQNYAITQRAYHDKDYKGLAKEQREAREANRKDRELDVRETYLGSKAAAAQAATLAKNSGYKAGKWEPDAAGESLILYGQDAQGNAGYPLAVANKNGTGIHPISMDKQWPSMVAKVEEKGFQLGVNDSLEPIVISPNKGVAVPYQDWVSGKEKWKPIADNSPVQPEKPETPKRALKGFLKSPRTAGGVGPDAPEGRKVRAQPPREYDKDGMDVPPPKEEKEDPAYTDAPGAEAMPEYTDKETTPEPDWREYTRNAQRKPAVQQAPEDPRNKSFASRVEDLNQERFADQSQLPPWARRALAAKGELREESEAPKRRTIADILEDHNQARFADVSQVPEWGRRAIAAAGGEPTEDHKASMAAMNDAVRAEMRRRGVDTSKPSAMPDHTPFQTPAAPAEEPRGAAVRMGGRDEGAVAGPDIRNKAVTLPVTKKAEAKPVAQKAQAKKAEAKPAVQKTAVRKAEAKPVAQKVQTKKAEAKPAKARISAPVEGELLYKEGDRVYKNKNKYQAGHEIKRKGRAYKVHAGAPVRAMASGSVTAVENMRGKGHLVIITDATGKNHVYTNTDSALRVGDRVSVGQAIGKAGRQFENDPTGNYVEYRVTRSA